MNKGILLLCTFVFLGMAAAAPLISKPSTLDLNVIKGETQSIKLNITNPNNYTLTGIKVEGDFVSSGIIDELKFNETREINVNINAPLQGDFVKTLKIIGFSRVNCSQLQSETADISIGSNGTTPKDIEICRGSNVRFSNNYGNSVRVVITDFAIDVLLATGNSHVQAYPNIGNFIYRIEPLIDLGNVKVIDTFQNIHDSLDDGIINLKLKSSLRETIIELQLSKTSFNMSYNTIINSFFIIKNKGNVQAEKVQFFGDWLTFDKANFNVPALDERAVNFVISPTITDISQTNKTYNKTIIVTGDNILRQEYNITIFVEQSGFVSGNISSPDWWIKRKLFCDAFPAAPDCLTEPLVIYRDKEIFDCPDILVNISPKKVQESLQECNNLRGDFSQFSNNVKLDMDSLKDTALKTIGLNSSIGDVGSKVEGFANVFYFVFGLIFLVFLGGGAAYLAIIYYKSRKLKLGDKI